MEKKKIIGHIMAATGKSVIEVAKAHKISPKSLYRVINGDSVSQTYRDIITGITNKTESELWPELVKEE